MKSKIKQTVNDSVNAFDFHYDLCKNGNLARIVSLFGIDGILYFCFYGIDDITGFLIVVHNDSRFLRIEKIDRCSFAVAISSEDLDSSVDMCMGMSEETVVWSEYADWLSFIRDTKDTVGFITLKKKVKDRLFNKKPAFYLDYERFESNKVAIISNSDFKGTAAVTADSIRSCLN